MQFRTRLVGVTVGLFLAVAGGASAAPPNVVVILTDDQRWDTLSSMPVVQSELVGKGVTFTNSFTVNPLCCPSRASILTGLYSHTTGVYTNGGLVNFNDRSTLATWLRRAGYRTGFFGKYLNSYRGTFVPPGWDSWAAFTPANVANFFDYALNVDGTIVEYGSEPGDYSTDVLATGVDEFIRASPGRPFFVMYAPYAPHLPATPAPRHANRFPGLVPWRPPSYDEPNVSDKPSWLRAYPRLHAPEELDAFRRRQLQSLLAVDEAVARVLSALEDTGALEDTLIVLTSDNGFLWGEHRLSGKQAPYEESIRVPLVIRYDRAASAPRIEPRLALNIDLAPTIASYAQTPRATDGRSLRALIEGRSPTWRRYFLVEGRQTGPNRSIPSYCAIRGSRYLYVAYGTQEEELYDLAVDPGQRVNLARRPGEKQRLATLRRRMLGLCSPPPPDLPLTWVCTHGGTAGSDRLVGTADLDSLCGRGGNDELLGRDGPDRLFGHGGRDSLSGGGGRDTLYARDKARDVLVCGPGLDRALADKQDQVAPDCERVSRALQAAPMGVASAT